MCVHARIARGATSPRYLRDKGARRAGCYRPRWCNKAFEKTTAESYVRPGAIANAQQRHVLKVLAGGRE
jgi:hypothetical protein